MSGTSMDGLDIAVCDITNEPFSMDLVASATLEIPRDLRKKIADVPNGNAADLAGLDIELGKYYAQAAGDWLDRQRLQVDALGSHGQTVFHRHGLTTLQIGEPSFLAQKLGCPVIADFRRADIAAGGCGAPLVPLFDIAMFGRDNEGIIALNIGGIANLTAIPALPQRPLATAFDTGPGNMVIDGLMRRLTGGRKRLDAGGALAAQGTIDRTLLDQLMKHPFLAQKPPRSAGREDFGDTFCDTLLAQTNPQSDADWSRLLATVTAWTAHAILASIRDHILPYFPVSQMLIGGGGVHNKTLIGQLSQNSNAIKIGAMDQAGINPDMREAMAFAFLAERFIRGQPGNLPLATGAARAAVLGKLVPFP